VRFVRGSEKGGTVLAEVGQGGKIPNVDAATLATAKDVGGWVFATVAISSVCLVIIRWLMRLLERTTNAVEKLSESVDGLTNEVRAANRRR
jgi:hypothetical protein